MQSFTFIAVLVALFQSSFSMPTITKRDHAEVLSKILTLGNEDAARTQSQNGLVGVYPTDSGGIRGMGRIPKRDLEIPSHKEADGRIVHSLTSSLSKQDDPQLKTDRKTETGGQQPRKTSANQMVPINLLGGLIKRAGNSITEFGLAMRGFISANVLGLGDGKDCGSSAPNLNLLALSNCKRSRITVPPTA